MKSGARSYTEGMKPVILHSDMNNFYASVEILYNSALRDKPVAVAGDEEARHGIVLAKNDIAKGFGIYTGQVLWEARQMCPGLVCVPAHYERYLAFSAQAREIYTTYTDQVEPFGLDECWLDVTGSVELFGDGPAIANAIRSRIRRELGLTVSVGVSFNKVFAKLGSDMKKPDATTVITPENYRERLYAVSRSKLADCLRLERWSSFPCSRRYRKPSAGPVSTGCWTAYGGNAGITAFAGPLRWWTRTWTWTPRESISFTLVEAALYDRVCAEQALEGFASLCFPGKPLILWNAVIRWRTGNRSGKIQKNP